VVEEDFDFEAAAEVVKTGVDRLISATKRGNNKQIAVQVGQVTRDLVALSKACLAEVEVIKPWAFLTPGSIVT
jgi:hypothetical protein